MVMPRRRALVIPSGGQRPESRNDNGCRFRFCSFDVVIKAETTTPTRQEATLRFMLIVKADANSEAGVMPSQQLLTEMGKYNEELVKAGIMLAGEGLHPTSKGKRIKFNGSNRIVTDGQIGRASCR